MTINATKPLISVHFLFPVLLAVSILTLNKANAQQTSVYPKVLSYFAVSNSIGTWNSNGFTSNFGNTYSVAFPIGINILKSDHFGFSFEVAPCIQTTNNISKVSSVTINPGAIFRFNHGYSIYGRLAFETAGRFGFGPTFSKIVAKGKNASCFVSVPVPVRFGNNLPASISTGVIVGVLF